MTLSQKKSQSYRNQAKILLENVFNFISCSAIGAALRSCGYDFTVAYLTLSAVEGSRRAMQDEFGKGENGAGKFTLFAPNVKVFIKGKRVEKDIELTNVHLIGEVNAIPELSKLHRDKENEVIGIDDTPREGQGLDPNIAAAVDGAATVPDEFECLCCYGDYPKAEMRECNEGTGHLVCKTCIYRFVSEQLDGNGTSKFPCIGEQDCQHQYKLAMLDNALTPKLKKRANDRRFREEMKAAGIDDDIWTCPKCAYIGFTGVSHPWIKCPECVVKYCTSCNEIFHENKTCDEVKKEKERLKNPHHRAHEAMSQACKRRCPHENCNQEYIKWDGCNKMTCNKCKGLSCYICEVKVTDYSHFCNHKLVDGACSRKCGKTCQLFTSTDDIKKIDQRRRHDAGRKALGDVGITDENQILSIIASPTKKKKQAAAPARPAAHAAPQRNNRAPNPPERAANQRVARPRNNPRQPAAAAANNQNGGRNAAVAAGAGVGVAAGNIAPRGRNDPPQVVADPPEPAHFRWLQHLGVIVFALLVVFFSTLEPQVPSDDGPTVIFRAEFTWHNGNGKGTLTIHANEEPVDKVNQFLLDNGLKGKRDSEWLKNHVCEHDNIVCNQFGPVKIGKF